MAINIYIIVMREEMREITFYLADVDVDRLFAIKELQGEKDLTGNEFARALLENELHRLFPDTPLFDDDGRVTNAERYRG